jgi:hypothetical protein
MTLENNLYYTNKEKNIFFVGDSFCASYNRELFHKLGSRNSQYGKNNSYIDLVARHFNCILQPHGYGGKSWWWSRVRFYRDLESIDLNSIFAIVFCHTDHKRINNSWNDNNELQHPDLSSEAKIFYKYYYDNEFNKWACENWFKEINEKFADVKTVHFNCFRDTVELSRQLNGVVINTPLIDLSLKEFPTSTNIRKMILNDKRTNHFSSRNNQVLANYIIRHLENYTPGQYELNLSDFELRGLSNTWE